MKNLEFKSVELDPSQNGNWRFQRDRLTKWKRDWEVRIESNGEKQQREKEAAD